MQISLIIPVFNAEPFIEKCVLSCVKQDLSPDNYEIIVINDGSTDSSYDKIIELAQNYKNIQVHNKGNGGVSTARNAGLVVAKGKYIWFIDADDWIPENILKSILGILEDNSLDMLQIGYSIVTNDKMQSCDAKLLVESSVVNPDIYIDRNLFVGGAWATIFQSKIVFENKIEFVRDLRLAEDQLFFLEVLNHSLRVKRTANVFYNYLNNALGAVNNSKFNDLIFSIEKISTFRYRERFKKYCDYLIIQQYISACHLDNANLARLNPVFRNVSISKKEFANFKSSSGKHNIFAKLCSIFGISIVPYYIAINKTTKLQKF